MSHDGVYDFYLDRIKACPLYGFKAGEEILSVIIECAFWDFFHESFLTEEEYNSIIKLCDQAHIKMMEENYNAGWEDNQ